jgi:hypothetical protein
MPAREADLSLDDLSTRSEKEWTVWGPCSGGVRIVFFCDGRLYTYSGGDARPADSAGIVEETISEYARSTAHPDVMAWLADAGHLPPARA